MVETVIALLMFIDHEIKEHRIQPSMSECLKGKTEIYMGEKSIKAFILE